MFASLTGSDQQSFFYSILLLVFLVGSIAFRREIALSKALKYLALWTIIAFIAVGLYAYRYEFADFKNRIIGSINPTAARLNDNGQLVINLASDGQFYVNIKINGVPVRFMIDTGASDVVINSDEAKKIGINIKKLQFDKRYETANGITYGAYVNLEEVEISGVKFNNIPASINGSNMGISLLGMSFLRQLKKYEFYQDKLILTL